METFSRTKGSPVPTQTTLGFDLATAIAPIDAIPVLSKIGDQWKPPSTDLNTPPDGVPA